MYACARQRESIEHILLREYCGMTRASTSMNISGCLVEHDARSLRSNRSVHDTSRANSKAIECIEMYTSASDSDEFRDLGLS